MTSALGRKYWSHVRFAANRTWSERSELFGRMALLPLFLGVLGALWKAVADGRMPLPVSGSQMIWYLAMTQWVLFCVPHPEFELEQQIRRGDITYQLMRPVSLVGTIYAEGLGTLLVQAPAFALGSFGSALLFAGVFPWRLGEVWLAVPLGLLGALVLFSFQVAIGISAFWFRNIAPLGWIWSKLTFVLGGLMLPLPVYPRWLERFALDTPFAQCLYGPASILFTSHASGLALFEQQITWLAIGIAVCWALARSAQQSLTIDGG
ncbi:MAG: ABC transporter permease [Myxococcales bacterium]